MLWLCEAALSPASIRGAGGGKGRGEGAGNGGTWESGMGMMFNATTAAPADTVAVAALRGAVLDWAAAGAGHVHGGINICVEELTDEQDETQDAPTERAGSGGLAKQVR